MRILIAEDEYSTRLLLTAVLTKFGHEVVVTENGSESWDELQKPNAPNLIILDWMMPVIDGLEIVRRVRSMKSPHRPYIIMLTAKDEKSDIMAGLAAGADDYLTKPFDHVELSVRVEIGRRMFEMQEQLAKQKEDVYQALEHIKTLQSKLPLSEQCEEIHDL